MVELRNIVMIRPDWPSADMPVGLRLTPVLEGKRTVLRPRPSARGAPTARAATAHRLASRPMPGCTQGAGDAASPDPQS